MRSKLFVAIVMGTITYGGAHAQPIRIGLSGPFSGPAADEGYAMRRGVELAVAEINRAGGVMGRPIDLAVRDDAGTVEQGLRAAHQLIGQEHVVATVGFANTDVALATQQLYQAAAIPVLNDVATGSMIAKQFAPPGHAANFIFQMAASDAVQASLIVDEAISHRGFKVPAVLADDTEYGRSSSAALVRALGILGVTPAANETVKVGDTDMTVQLSRVRRANADVILVFAPPAELVAIINSMADLGWKLPIIGGWPLSTAAFLRAGFNTDGVSMPQTFIEAGNTAKRAEFYGAYTLTYRVGRILSADCAAQGYDSIWLLKAAIEQAGTTDGAKLRGALENLATKVEGVVTTYDHPFSTTDHEAISANIPIFGVVRNQHVVAAHENDIAGGRPVRMK